MKRKSKIAMKAVAFSAAALASVSVIACEGRGVTAYDRDPLVAQLMALGFRSDMIEDRGDYFLVDGDIRISKEAVPRLVLAPPPSVLDAARQAQPRPEFQWNTDSLVGQTQVQTIVADLSGLASQPAWQVAARQALAMWNGTCSGAHLLEGSPGDITFSTTNAFPNNVAAVGSFPADAPADSHKPGPTIQVNTPYSGTPNDSLTKLRNTVHEIGHTIGFRHTNWQAQGETQQPYGANLITGTPQTDDASVMNGGTATQRWADFSTNDRTAVRTLYTRCLSIPTPSVAFKGCTGFAGSANILVTTNADATTLTVEKSPAGQNTWSVYATAQNVPVGTQSTFTIFTPGPQEIRAKSTDASVTPPQDSPYTGSGSFDC